MNSIEVNNLCKSYKGTLNKSEIRALDNLSFSCKPGLIYGLIGPNGSGKTTCLRILGGILHPTSGTMKFAQVDFTHNFEDVRLKVGFVSSTAQPYNRLTAKEFLLYFGRLTQVANLNVKICTLIQQLKIDEFQDRLCGELSTGMKQRVAIARALIHEPEILIFDEPTVGLDIPARRDIFDLLVGLKSNGRTLLFSTHIPEEAERLCDHLLIISNGKIIIEGSVPDILIKSGHDNLEEAFIKFLKL